MLNLVKRYCRFTGRRCYKLCCTIFYFSSGDIGCCPVHGNPEGFHMSRVVKPDRSSIFDIWARSVR